MPYPKAQIHKGIWEPLAEMVRLRCLHAVQILARGLCCFICSYFTPVLGPEKEMAEGA